MMKKVFLIVLLLLCLTVPTSASEWTAPEVTGEASQRMPDRVDSFGEGIWYILRTTFSQIAPSISECTGVCLSLIAACMLLSLLRSFEGPGQAAAQLCGVVAVACILLRPTHTMITLGVETVQTLSEYNKLLLPVLTAALAAQGGTTTSAALYTATTLFDTVLSGLLVSCMVPMVYIYLALSVVNAAVGDGTIAAVRNQTKSLLTWGLKISLYAFTGYISVSGVVSGTVDAAAVKAAKLGISSAVPVVGSILSDASESILVSAGIVKNSVGIYGLFAVLAIVIAPFLRIAVQYGLVKLTSGICAMFAEKRLTDLMTDYCTGMGLLLAITGTVSLILLISVVCFLKGMG